MKDIAEMIEDRIYGRDSEIAKFASTTVNVNLMEAFDSYLNHKGIMLDDIASDAGSKEAFDAKYKAILVDFRSNLGEYIDVDYYLEDEFRYEDFIYD